MHASRFFIFYMISLSVFSCSAMEPKNQIQVFSRQQFVNNLPVFGRLAQGESGSQVALNIIMYGVNGAETIRQGYHSPTTQAAITSVRNGADALANNAYSAGVTLCTATKNFLQYAYNQRSEQNTKTFGEALTVYNQQMNLIRSAPYKEACQANILDSLTTIKTDISAITQLINQAKGDSNNSSGIRTTIIDYVIKEVNDNKITEENTQDYINIINNIAQFSKTENGQNNLEASVTNFETHDQEKRLSKDELLLELEKKKTLIFFQHS